ncbi:collagen alpha-6(VI) chain-like isoform X2 [Gouania willdenowi]|uniref:collagen alpha-6(VI) chain-like isoform X2 n=1 Tax=Gouania willdenowi TaxID=441366 RepID=UPI0010555239|nr:collagen alpha-6(VI) chain-like isoform X2 [Gouania willdenowi]
MEVRAGIFIISIITVTLRVLAAQIQECENATMGDIVFIIDGSADMDARSFQEVRTFLRSVVKNLDVGPKKIQLGVVQSGQSPQLEFSLQQHQDRKALLGAVEKIQQQSGDAQFDEAPQYVQQSSFAPEAGGRARQRVPQVAVVLSAGGEQEEAETEARALRQQGVLVFEVSVGEKNTNQQKQRSIANWPPKRFQFRAENFEKLQEQTNRLLPELCDVLEAQRKALLDRFADIVFLVDSSISSAEFSRFRNTLVQTIIQHNVGASANRIGLAQYGAEVNVEFQLNTFQTKQETLNAARRFKLRPQPGRPTNLGSALRFAEEGLFSSGAGGRAEQGARQILVLVAGKDSDDPVVEAGRMLKAAGVTVLGVGDEAASENLNEFAHFVVDSLKVPRLKQILSEPVEEVTHGCKGANLADIVFIVEESTSIGHVNFQLIRTFLSSIVSGLVISPDKVQVGLVSYSDEPEVQFYLDTFREKAELLQFINILPYHGGKTNTGAALNFTLDNVFTEQRGSRRGVQKVAVVITEGKSQDEVSQAAIKLRRAGITLYGVGIRDFNEAEMAEMVSQPLYKHVYTVDSFTRLKPLREILQKNLCNNIIHNVIAHSRSLTEIQEACVRTDEADIFFLIDDSGSISNPDFYDMQKFVISFLHTFNIGPQNVRIGLVKYSDSPTLEFDLSTYTDAKSMEKAVLKILHEGGGTETGKALSVMGPYFEKAKGSRDHTVPQYLIVVTDGESTDKVKAPAEQLRAQDIIVYAVGVKDSNQTELDQISGDPKRTFVVSNFDALKSIQQEIVTDICSPVACENVPSDIIFLTDSSESIKEEDFTKMKEFIKSIVDRSNVSPDQVHVGLMQFSSNHHLEFDLKRYDSKQDVLKAIDTMEQINLGTRTGQAITAVSQYFHASAGGRPHLKQRLVVITDGESKDDVKIPAEQLRQLGVIIYAIGVEEANSTQLLEISGSLDRVFNQRNFDALKELESQLALKFCEDYCKIDSADIIFLVDVSQSSDAQQFSSMRALMKSLVNHTIVGDDLTRIGIIAFSDDTQLKFSLKGSQSKSQIYQTIDRLLPTGQRAFTGAGLEFSLDFFKGKQGGRPKRNVQVLIVLTDEQAMDPEKLQPASNALRANGVTVLSVGVRNSKKEELNIIAGGNASHVFFAKEYKELETVYKDVIPAICNMSKPVCDRTDLVFLLDRSSSIHPNNHRLMVDFVADVVKSFKIGESLARVAVAQFSNEPRDEFYLNTYFSEQDVIKHLGQLLDTGGDTYIGKALRFIRKYFEEVHGSRRGVPRNLVLITDGDSQDSVEEEAQHLRQMGIQILVIAIRNTYDIQLERIAGSSKKLFSVPDFSSLKNIKMDIVDTVCFTETEPKDNCIIDVAIGFDISRSRRPDELLVSGRLAQVLEEVYYSISLVDLCCGSSTPLETNIAFYVVDGEGFPVYDTNFEGYDKDVLRKVMNHTLSQPTFFNTALMTFYQEMFKSKSSARVKVLLIFSDGLNDDVRTLERESERLHTSGVSALLTVALDGADMYQLQSVEFGRGLLYKPPLRISTPNLGRSVLQHISAVADRECCNVTCKCQGPDGERGDPGKQGSKGERGLDGRRGFPGDEGLMGGRGPPGAPGPAGTPGCPGSRGPKGSRGFSGNRGERGGDGLDGVDGEPGADGLDGVRGEAGRSGNPGGSGTSGEPGPKGRPGLKGEPGNPGSNNIIQGPKGEEGLSGMPGMPGPEGRPGELGADGNPGPNGRRGLSGEKGSPGEAGDPGLQGTAGAQGPQGPRGKDGEQGPDGEPGLPGRGGDPGPAGEPGQGGRRGSHGQKGQQGDPGIKGDSGPLGPRGLPGAEGRDGLGTQGDTGAKGDSGFSGYPGLPGENGLQGPKGQHGGPGTRGRDGETGKPGEPGEPGGRGYPGHTGPVGPPGDKQVCPLISSIRDNCACCHGESQCPSYPTELVFGLDMSEDVTPASFDRQRLALLTLLDGVSVAESNCPSGARVSVVGFSSYTKHLIRFQDHRRKQQLLNAVQNITLETTNQRHLGAAMRFVAHHVFKRVRSGMTMRKVAVFFSDGPTQDPEDIVTAMMEYRALDIVPAVVSLRDASEISQAIKVDDSGNSILTVLRGGDLKEELRTIKSCAICYDPCRRSEACAVIQEPLQPQRVDVDLVLVPGGSREMQADQFTGARQLLASVVEGLEVSPEPGRADGRARVALVQRDQVEFGLQSFQKREMMRDRLLELEQRPGSSESGQALDLALTRVLLKAPAPRRRKALLVVESAAALGDQDRLHRVSLRAKCQRVALFVVTVGDGYNRTQVEDLAGLPVQQHLIHVSSLKPEQQEYTRRFFRVFLSALHSDVYSDLPLSHRAECSLLSHQEELNGNSEKLEEEFADEATENRRQKDVNTGQKAAPTKLKTFISEDVCSLPVDRGTCAKYTVMWFFNFETKRCSRFWFGGCEGNGNRFKTKIRCQRLCGGS